MLSKNFFIKKPISLIGIFLSFLVLFTMVYAASIQSDYFYESEFEYFTLPGGQLLDTFLEEGLREGRLSESLILYTISSNIESSESTGTIRFFGLIGIALFASVTFAVFRRSGFRYDHAFLMSVLICLLPSFQVIASWMVIIPAIYSASLAALSALLMFNIASKEDKKGWVNNAIVFLTAIILLIVALSINQPPAMMYWSMGLIFFLAGDNWDLSKKECRQKVIIYFLVGFISIAIYYLIFIKLIPFMIGSSIARDNVIPIRGMPNRLMWFLTGPLVRTMNLWNPDPTFIFASFTGVIILSGIIVSSLLEIKEKKQFSAIYWFAKYFLISSLVILCFLPKLMVREPSVVPTHWIRTLISLGPAVAILFFWGTINIMELFKFVPGFSTELRKAIITIILTILTVVTAFLAYNNVNKFAARFSEEFKFITETVKEYGVSNISSSSKIYFRSVKPQGFPRDDRFNELKAPLHGGWRVWVIIRQALYEAGVKKDIQISKDQITQGAHDAPIPNNSDVLVIDMRKFNEFMRN